MADTVSFCSPRVTYAYNGNHQHCRRLQNKALTPAEIEELVLTLNKIEASPGFSLTMLADEDVKYLIEVAVRRALH